jgi:hypothetical protein
MRTKICIRELLAFLFFALTLVGQGTAAQLKVVVLDSKTGKPLQRKNVCVSFTTTPRYSTNITPVCNHTGADGSTALDIPQPPPAWAYVALRTNDLLPCFATGHPFSMDELAATGVTAPNTCGLAAAIPPTRAGEVVVFAHQMTFSEVFRAIWKEL